MCDICKIAVISNVSEIEFTIEDKKVCYFCYQKKLRELENDPAWQLCPICGNSFHLDFDKIKTLYEVVENCKNHEDMKHQEYLNKMSFLKKAWDEN